jgi:hypothetical protein
MFGSLITTGGAPMPISPVDFFPADASLRFHEINTGVSFTLQLRSRPQGAGRAIELTPQPDQDKGLFFDRMTATASSLAINRVKLGPQLLKLDTPPATPLVITMDDKPNHVADLLPKIKGSFPAGNPPYDGTVVAKEVKAVASDTVWAIKIHSRSTPQNAVAIRWGFILSRAHGFAFQMGDLYGFWYFYKRTDLPAALNSFIEDFQHNFLKLTGK